VNSRPAERIDPAGAAAASVTAILYGSSYVATAIALHGFTPLTVALWRGVIGGLALALLVALVRSPAVRPARLDRTRAARLLVLAALTGPAFIVLMNVAVSLAGASITAFVAGLYAVLGAALAVPLLGERLERSTLGALLLALIGAALLGELPNGGQTALGAGVGLLAAVVFATFLVLSRRWCTVHDLPGPTVALAAQALSALVTLAWAGATGPLLPVAPTADAVAAVVWLGLMVSALATVLVILGMRRLPARRASAFLLLNPPSAAVLSWLLLGERFSPAQLAGAAMVLVAMAVASGLATMPRSAGGVARSGGGLASDR
jgi:drug/metabolite transporter (DMT)-like permease